MSGGVETEKEEMAEKGGELLFCGCTNWDDVGRRKGEMDDLISPTRLRTLVGVDIRFVASGCASCHCVALDVEGRCYTWGRNEKGQLGHGDDIQRDRPTVVSELSKYKITRAAAGKGHTVVMSEDQQSLSFGWNKNGQLGSGSVKNEVEASPVHCLVSEVKNVACGAEFTIWLTSVEEASILTAGLSQYGQLGHGTDNEYNTKESSVKLAFEPQPRPKAIATLSGEIIVKVACGANHTVAVDNNGLVFTWGFGGYGRLGHREQKDEWVPRRVDVFQKYNTLPPDAVISAGTANSACTAGGNQLYMWGKIKNSGDDWMYPKPLMDLSGWNLRCMDSGHMHHCVGADSSCISWGHAQHGELGYGPMGQKSSAVPKKIEILDGFHVMGVACGFAHTMIIVDRENVGNRLAQLDVYDGKASNEEKKEAKTKTPVAEKRGSKASESASKRKKVVVEASSESSEELEEEEDESESESEEDVKPKKRGKGSSAKGRGRGKASSVKGRGQNNGQPKLATGRRGRPRK